MPLLRIITLPLRSEVCLFLTLSILSLIFGILESLLYAKFFDDADESGVDAVVNVSEHEPVVKRSILETKSIFFIAVVFLFGFVYLFTKVIYYLFFGGLSENEHSRLSRMLLKFVILRSIILSGALNVSNLPSVFGWLVWFSALGFIHSCTLVANVRCNRFSASSQITFREWLRMTSAIGFLFISCLCLLLGGLSHRYLLADVRTVDQAAVTDIPQKPPLVNSLNAPTAIGVIVARIIGHKQGDLESIDVAIYLVSEVTLLFCLVLHLLAGLLIQAYDRWKLSGGQTWPQQNIFTYYLDLVHVLVYHFTEIVHYSHLLLWSRIFSVASLIVFLHIRSAYSSFAHRIKRHLAYRRLSKFIMDNYFLGSVRSSNVHKDKDLDVEDTTRDSDDFSDLKDKDASDVCAICWEPMLTWRRLPCRHNFHEPCLRSWLEQNPSCPTCRRDLGIPPSILSSSNRSPSPNDHLGLGLILRDFTRAARNLPAVGNATAQPAEGVAVPLVNRNLFAAAVGLNLGVSIGSAPIVTAAAQAVARETLPTNSVPSEDSGSDERESPVASSSSLPADSSQPPLPNNPPQQDETDQVRHRSFHFDGSRYFSWLPSLHVELSEVIREVFSGGVTENPVRTAPRITSPLSNVPTNIPDDRENRTSFNSNAYELIRLPASLRVPAQEIAAMFPQFPLSDIVADLLITGMPEATVENLIQRPVPPVHVEAVGRMHQLEEPSIEQSQNEHLEPSTSVAPIPSNNLLLERRRELLENARKRFLSINPSST